MDADSGIGSFTVIVQLFIDICRMEASLTPGTPPRYGYHALPTLRVLGPFYLHGWCYFSRTRANGNKRIPPNSRSATTAAESGISDKKLLVYNFILDFSILCDAASYASTSRYILSRNLQFCRKVSHTRIWYRSLIVRLADVENLRRTSLARYLHSVVFCQ